MKRLDRYLLRRGFVACLPLLLAFWFTGLALIGSSGLDLSPLWLAYLSLPVVLLLASFYTVLRSITDGEALVPSLAGLSYTQNYRALSWLGAALWLLLAALPKGSGKSETFDDLLRFDAGAGWHAVAGPQTLMAYRQHVGAEFQDVLLLVNGKKPRRIQKLTRLETADGKQHYLADDEELVFAFRQRRPTRAVRRLFFERAPLAAFAHRDTLWLHLLFALYCVLVPLQVARQFYRFRAGEKLSMLLAVVLPLLSGLCLFWLVGAQALFGMSEGSTIVLALAFLLLPLL